jgi:hypothetical protein
MPFLQAGNYINVTGVWLFFFFTERCWMPSAACVSGYLVYARLRALVSGCADEFGVVTAGRRYSDAWFAAAKRRRAGDTTARFPRRRRALAGTGPPRTARNAQRGVARPNSEEPEIHPSIHGQEH